MMDAMSTTVKTEKRCPRCGTIYPLVDAEGNPLPREQLMFDRIKAARYRDGERLRSICKACHSADVSRRLTEKKPHATPDARPGLSNPQAAELAGVSVSTIARAKRAGELPHELTTPAVEAWARGRSAELVGASPLEAAQGALEADRVETELVRLFFAPAGVAE